MNLKDKQEVNVEELNRKKNSVNAQNRKIKSNYFTIFWKNITFEETLQIYFTHYNSLKRNWYIIKEKVNESQKQNN